jgi:RimJ/RimL family protein N-acetyltransferase
MSAPERIRIRTAAPGDLAWLLALAGSDAVAPFLAPEAHLRVAEALAAGELRVAEDGMSARVGGVRVVVVNERNRIAAIRTLMVDPARRGRGLGAALLRTLAAELLTDGGMHRLEADVFGFNAAALRAFEAAGFVREGARRRAYHRHGTWQDAVLLGMLADDLAADPPG